MNWISRELLSAKPMKHITNLPRTQKDIAIKAIETVKKNRECEVEWRDEPYGNMANLGVDKFGSIWSSEVNLGDFWRIFHDLENPQ